MNYRHLRTGIEIFKYLHDQLGVCMVLLCNSNTLAFCEPKIINL